MSDHTEGGPVGARYAVSCNGWMTAPAFQDWFKSQFIPSLPNERPILLILDGHTSHINYEICRTARSNDIHLLKLPSHCTHLLQRLDLAVLKPIKSVWYKVVEDFTRRERRVLTIKDFPSLFASALRNGYKKDYGIAGFRKAGIIPFNPDVISSKQLGPSIPFSETNDTILNTTPTVNFTMAPAPATSISALTSCPSPTAASTPLHTPIPSTSTPTSSVL